MTVISVERRQPTRWIGWMKRERVVVLCVAVLALASLGAIAAPLIAPDNPNTFNLSLPYASPSAQHLLGTDSYGRDLFSRMLYGGRTSLLGPLLVIIIATAVAVLLAVAAVWIGGWVDHVVSAMIDITFAFPGLLLAIGAVAVFGYGLTAPVIALAISYVPYIARVLRGALIRERHLPYIEAVVVQGLPSRRVVARHLLPNVFPLLLAQATLAFAWATIDLAAISYLGLGVQPPTADWGRMVSDGQAAILAGHPEEALYPGMALVIVVVAVTMLGRRFARTQADVI